MAKIGLQGTKYSVLKDGKPTGAKILALSIKADIKINATNEKLYADDGVAENVNEFVDGTITFEGDDISDSVTIDILGVKKSTEDGNEELIFNTNDVAPYVMIGFVARKIKNNIISYEANIFSKVKFGIPDESYETKGQSISFKSTTLIGTIIRDDKTNIWKQKQTFDTFELANAYVENKLKIEV